MVSLAPDTSFYNKPQPTSDLLALLLKSQQSRQAQPATQQNQAASNTSGLPPEVTTGQSASVPAKYAQLYQQAEDKYGLPAGYLATTAGIESSHDPHSYNEFSGAKGQFQFIDSTGRQYGLVGRGFDKRSDPAASTDAAARLAVDNQNQLRQALGRNPTPGELYLAHQQGAGGAIKLLTNPNIAAGRLVDPHAVAVNGGNPNAPAGQFTQKWAGRFDNTAQSRAMAYSSTDRPAGASQLDNQGNEIVDKIRPNVTVTRPPGDDDAAAKWLEERDKRQSSDEKAKAVDDEASKWLEKRDASLAPTKQMSPNARVQQGFDEPSAEGSSTGMASNPGQAKFNRWAEYFRENPGLTAGLGAGALAGLLGPALVGPLAARAAGGVVSMGKKALPYAIGTFLAAHGIKAEGTLMDLLNKASGGGEH